MTRLLALPTGLASRICAVCSALVMLTAAAPAHSADAAAAPPAQPPAQDEATGGCEPIGLTASGEIVFPFRCKDMVERQHAAATKPSEPTPAIAAAAPAIQEKPQATPQAQPVAATKMAAVRPAHAATVKPVSIHPAGAVLAAAKPATQPVDAAHSPKTLAPKILAPKKPEKSAEKTTDAKTIDAKTTDAKTTAKPTDAKSSEGKAGDAKTAGAKTADARPADTKTADTKTADAKTADAKTADVKTDETKPAETTKSIPKVAGNGREHRMGPPGCTQFQSYNAMSATYLGFDGRRHPCQEAMGRGARNQVAGNQAARTQSPHKPSAPDIKH